MGNMATPNLQRKTVRILTSLGLALGGKEERAVLIIYYQKWNLTQVCSSVVCLV